MSAGPCTVALLGTCDTKLEELLYVRQQLVNVHNVQPKLIDVGRTPTSHPLIDVTHDDIFSISGGKPDLTALPRGKLITTLIEHTTTYVAKLHSAREIHGIISLGGSGGSSLAAGVMRRALPLGFPKLIVSTMAAGDVSAFGGEDDITMTYSVVDIAGLNDILLPILDNAAGGIAGMARAYRARCASSPSSSSGLSSTSGFGHDGSASPRTTKRIAITMFGVTTPAVTHARELLSRYACTTYVFHATGAGGRAMERLLSQGFFDGVLDLTTTELADELVGGVLSAGPDRLLAAARKGIPQVISLGALDMVNFGPRDTVPERFRHRTLFEHNPSITLMRTSRDECAELGRQIAEKLRSAGARADRTEVWVPKGGTSMLSVKDAPFWDAGADAVLFREMREGLTTRWSSASGRIRLQERDVDINNEEFVRGMVDSLVRMMGLS